MTAVTETKITAPPGITDMTTLAQILETDHDAAHNDISAEMVRAVKAAYWAGQSLGIAQERQRAKERLSTVPQSRYRHLVAKIASALTPNLKAIPGLVDEVEEIKGWEFSL